MNNLGSFGKDLQNFQRQLEAFVTDETQTKDIQSAKGTNKVRLNKKSFDLLDKHIYQKKSELNSKIDQISEQLQSLLNSKKAFTEDELKTLEDSIPIIKKLDIYIQQIQHQIDVREKNLSIIQKIKRFFLFGFNKSNSQLHSLNTNAAEFYSLMLKKKFHLQNDQQKVINLTVDEKEAPRDILKIEQTTPKQFKIVLNHPQITHQPETHEEYILDVVNTGYLVKKIANNTIVESSRYTTLSSLEEKLHRTQKAKLSTSETVNSIPERTHQPSSSQKMAEAVVSVKALQGWIEDSFGTFEYLDVKDLEETKKYFFWKDETKNDGSPTIIFETVNKIEQAIDVTDKTEYTIDVHTLYTLTFVDDTFVLSDENNRIVYQNKDLNKLLEDAKLEQRHASHVNSILKKIEDSKDTYKPFIDKMKDAGIFSPSKEDAEHLFTFSKALKPAPYPICIVYEESSFPIALYKDEKTEGSFRIYPYRDGQGESNKWVILARDSNAVTKERPIFFSEEESGITINKRPYKKIDELQNLCNEQSFVEQLTNQLKTSNLYKTEKDINSAFNTIEPYTREIKITISSDNTSFYIHTKNGLHVTKYTLDINDREIQEILLTALQSTDKFQAALIKCCELSSLPKVNRIVMTQEAVRTLELFEANKNMQIFPTQEKAASIFKFADEYYFNTKEQNGICILWKNKTGLPHVIEGKTIESEDTATRPRIVPFSITIDANGDILYQQGQESEAVRATITEDSQLEEVCKTFGLTKVLTEAIHSNNIQQLKDINKTFLQNSSAYFLDSATTSQSVIDQVVPLLELTNAPTVALLRKPPQAEGTLAQVKQTFSSLVQNVQRFNPFASEDISQLGKYVLSVLIKVYNQETKGYTYELYDAAVLINAENKIVMSFSDDVGTRYVPFDTIEEAVQAFNQDLGLDGNIALLQASKESHTKAVAVAKELQKIQTTGNYEDVVKKIITASTQQQDCYALYSSTDKLSCSYFPAGEEKLHQHTITPSAQNNFFLVRVHEDQVEAQAIDLISKPGSIVVNGHTYDSVESFLATETNQNSKNIKDAQQATSAIPTSPAQASTTTKPSSSWFGFGTIFKWGSKVTASDTSEVKEPVEEVVLGQVEQVEELDETTLSVEEALTKANQDKIEALYNSITNKNVDRQLSKKKANDELFSIFNVRMGKKTQRKDGKITVYGTVHKFMTVYKLPDEDENTAIKELNDKLRIIVLHAKPD